MSVQERGAYFDDKALAAMIVAYDKTCRALLPSLLHPLVREVIGKQIIEAARQGERDPEILHQQALKTVGIEQTANVLAA
jgi:dephospho-CoA kinase